ncbi:helix-turn-helix domain-containing protein [Microseira sp. BLCC-F43]
MLLTYQYKLKPNADQMATMTLWGELLRRHWNYALLRFVGLKHHSQ